MPPIDTINILIPAYQCLQTFLGRPRGNAHQSNFCLISDNCFLRFSLSGQGTPLLSVCEQLEWMIYKIKLHVQPVSKHTSAKPASFGNKSNTRWEGYPFGKL